MLPTSSFEFKSSLALCSLPVTSGPNSIKPMKNNKRKYENIE
jgi:hypothetical protein